jgi:hypothetical protein
MKCRYKINEEDDVEKEDCFVKERKEKDKRK